jgi:hypothetical protein
MEQCVDQIRAALIAGVNNTYHSQKMAVQVAEAELLPVPSGDRSGGTRRSCIPVRQPPHLMAVLVASCHLAGRCPLRIVESFKPDERQIRGEVP